MAVKTSYPYVGAMTPSSGGTAKYSYPYAGAMTPEGGSPGPATIATYDGVLAAAAGTLNGASLADIAKWDGVA